MGGLTLLQTVHPILSVIGKNLFFESLCGPRRVYDFIAPEFTAHTVCYCLQQVASV